MEANEKLKAAIESAVEKHTDNLDAAIKCAARNVRKLEDAEIDVALWQRGLAEQVYDCRHNLNTALRASTRIAGDPKVIAGNSATASRVGRALAEYKYEYFIAGQVLGDLLGEQLIGLAETEEAMADGHAFNSRLLRRLKPMVSDTKTVRQAISARKLKQIFVELQAGGGTKLAG